MRIKLLADPRHMAHRFIRKFLKSNSSFHYRTIVDLGSGKSPYKSIFTYDRWKNVDIEQRGTEDIVVSDLNKKIDLPDNYADLILCTEVLEHLHAPQKCLTEIKRVLSENGILLATVPFVWHEHEAPNDYYRYTRFSLEKMLREAGFNRIEITPNCGNWCTALIILMLNMRHTSLGTPFIVVLNCLCLLLERIEKPATLPEGFNIRAS